MSVRSGLLLVVVAALTAVYWFRWRPVAITLAELRARADAAQHAIDVGAAAQAQRVELTGAVERLRARLRRSVVPSADPDTDAVVSVTRLARRLGLEVVTVGAPAFATPPPAASTVAAQAAPPVQGVRRTITVRGPLARELRLLDRIAGLDPLIDVEGVALRTSAGGVEATVAYAAISLDADPGPAGR